MRWFVFVLLLSSCAHNGYHKYSCGNGFIAHVKQPESRNPALNKAALKSRIRHACARAGVYK